MRPLRPKREDLSDLQSTRQKGDTYDLLVLFYFSGSLLQHFEFSTSSENVTGRNILRLGCKTRVSANVSTPGMNMYFVQLRIPDPVKAKE